MSVTHILGFPRIGINRELKFAIESFWAGKINENSLYNIGENIRLLNWSTQIKANISYITVGDFAWYDHVLDTLILLGAVPTRFKFDYKNFSFKNYFTLARGDKNNFSMEMTKWFNTNYHYLVPEWTADISFNGCCDLLLKEIFLAYTKSNKIKIVLLGPLTLLYLGKIKFGLLHKLDLLPKLLISYINIIKKLKKIGISLIQIDEPILTLELEDEWINAFINVYEKLGNIYSFLLLTTYFETIDKYCFFLRKLPIYGIHIDLIFGIVQLNNFLKFWPINKILSIGIVDGRNIWCCNLEEVILNLELLYQKMGYKLWISSSCSFLHIPLNLKNEKSINFEIKSWLSFAIQKLDEIFIIKEALFGALEKVEKYIFFSSFFLENKRNSKKINNFLVQDSVKEIENIKIKRKFCFSKRITIQNKYWNFPKFPTTTIGSFPQTLEIRKLRSNYKFKKISVLEYKKKIKDEIRLIIKKQEDFGLDILVHGEPERNDMVEYFAEQLSGYGFTSNGWVQSYGTRCVKPPFIYGDISRTKAMTVYFTKFAQSLTSKPVKGMLTGPVTMLLWSFIRNDQSHKIIALQIALALKEEVKDLESAGIGIIQIDEPAFREGLPLKKSKWEDYLEWAVHAFKICSSYVKNITQIHTHMCYSEFNDILKWIFAMDADVITIETAKSNMKLLNNFNYDNDIGPGVYDIHSPRIPNIIEISNLIKKALEFITPERLWINPDCGLKTRTWEEISLALINMVKVAKIFRIEEKK